VLRINNWIRNVSVFLLISYPLVAEETPDSYKSWLNNLNIHQQGALPNAPTYADYLATMASNNPEIRELYHQWQSADKQIKVAGAWSDPQLKAGASLQPVVTAQGPQDLKLGITQAIPRRSEIRSALLMQEQVANAAYANLNSRLNDLNLELKYTYADFYLRSQQIAIQKQTRALLTNWQEVLLTRYRNAAASYPDLVKTQLELISLEDRIRVTEVKVKNIEDELRILLHLDGSSELHSPSSLNTNAEKFEDINDSWLSNNPSVLIQQSIRSAAKYNEQLTRSKTRPQLLLGLDWTLIGETDVVNPALKSGEDAFAVNVGISVPLWRTKNKASIASAKSNLLAHEAKYAAQEHAMELTMEQTKRDYRDALRRIELLEQNMIPKSQEAYEVLETAYTAGNADILSLLDSVENLLKYQLQLEEARVGLWKVHARLNHLRGIMQ